MEDYNSTMFTHVMNFIQQYWFFYYYYFHSLINVMMSSCGFLQHVMTRNKHRKCKPKVKNKSIKVPSNIVKGFLPQNAHLLELIKCGWKLCDGN
jgi:hypothetical protein